MANSRSPYFDFSDKLNFFWSSLILLMFALGIGVLRYVSLNSLITCWTPAMFTNQHVEYTHETCWQNEGFYLPMDEVVETTHGLNPAFHSWIPAVFIFMILGFKIPQAVKCMLDILLGTSSLTYAIRNENDLQKDRTETLAELIKDSLKNTSIIRSLAFFVTKILVCINLVVQFIFVRTYFRNWIEYGMSGNKTIEIPYYIFPKVELCDFQIRQLQTIQRFTVQCDMPVNYLYESFFKIFGFWILGVGIITGLVFVTQMVSLFIPPFVKIRFRGIIPEKELSLRGIAVDDALLLLEDVKDTYGIAMARDVAEKLWHSTIIQQIPTAPAGPAGADCFREIPMTNIADHSSLPLLQESICAQPEDI